MIQGNKVILGLTVLVAFLGASLESPKNTQENQTVCMNGHVHNINGLTMSKMHDIDGNHIPCEVK